MDSNNSNTLKYNPSYNSLSVLQVDLDISITIFSKKWLLTQVIFCFDFFYYTFSLLLFFFPINLSQASLQRALMEYLEKVELN